MIDHDVHDLRDFPRHDHGRRGEEWQPWEGTALEPEAISWQ
jgi:hypothetical protein